MRIELRNGQCFISGYVNAVERLSKPLVINGRSVRERVEAGVFENAINRAQAENRGINLLINHNVDMPLVSTSDGQLGLREDSIGLYAETVVGAPYADLIKERASEVRGWSFGFRTIADEYIENEDKLVVRVLKEIELDEVSLLIGVEPAYIATEAQVRSLEIRCEETGAAVVGGGDTGGGDDKVGAELAKVFGLRAKALRLR